MNDQLINHEKNDRQDDLLNRVWIASRPAGLSDEAFDQLWAKAQHLHDNPSTLMGSPVGSGRLWAFIPIALAAAAALFLAVSFGLRPVNPEGASLVEIPRTQPLLVSSPFDLEPHETLVIEIDGNVVRDHRLEPEVRTSLALNNIPVNNATDILNWMEAHSND